MSGRSPALSRREHSADSTPGAIGNPRGRRALLSSRRAGQEPEKVQERSIPLGRGRPLEVRRCHGILRRAGDRLLRAAPRRVAGVPGRPAHRRQLAGSLRHNGTGPARRQDEDARDDQDPHPPPPLRQMRTTTTLLLVNQADTLAHPSGSLSSQARRAAAGTTTHGRRLRTTRSTKPARSVVGPSCARRAAASPRGLAD